MGLSGIDALVQTKGTTSSATRRWRKGADAKFVFQGVGMLFDGAFSKFAWGPTSRAVPLHFIGRNLDEKGIGVMACQIAAACTSRRAR